MKLLEERLRQVAVIGAAGKMGRGISLLLLQEMALLALGKKSGPAPLYHLSLVDSDPSSYYDLKGFLKQGLERYAEKNINVLRSLFIEQPDLISNEEMIREFTAVGLRLVDCSAVVESIVGADLVFEAVFEEAPLKKAILAKVHKIAPSAYVFTNTSSIPIHELAQDSGIDSLLIGYHFYNPPVVQKLLEIIPSQLTEQALIKTASDLAKRLKKIVVYSADAPGFIGNGHFAREILYACQTAESLAKEYSLEEAVQIVDSATREGLLRPMGIFQLMDYVGLNIVENILVIMKRVLPPFDENHLLVKRWLSDGLAGGQTPSGIPKNGIFSYKNGVQDGIWSLELKKYIPLKPISTSFDLSWKKIQKNPELKAKIPAFFQSLFAGGSQEGILAKKYLIESKKITEELVSSKVAASMQDVRVVLKNGFFHAYAPDEVI